jgi:hypothetical protein
MGNDCTFFLQFLESCMRNIVFFPPCVPHSLSKKFVSHAQKTNQHNKNNFCQGICIKKNEILY